MDQEKLNTCPECHYADGRHRIKCTRSTIESIRYILIELQEEVKKQRDRYLRWATSQRTARKEWEGKFRTVAAENNALRKKLSRQVTASAQPSIDRDQERGKAVQQECTGCHTVSTRVGGYPQRCYKCFRSFDVPDTHVGDMAQHVEPEGEKAFDISMTATLNEMAKKMFGPKPEDGEKQEVPVMSDQLAAEADMAALDFGRLAASPEGEGPDGSELTDAYEAGQSWMWRKLQAEISSLKSRYEIVTADWNEEKNALQAEIELLRKSGATLRPDTYILDVIQWAVKFNVRMESGYWRMDYSSIAYTDEAIAKAFQNQYYTGTVKTGDGEKQEVPEHIAKWIEEQDRDYPGSGHAIGWKKGAIAMYWMVAGRVGQFYHDIHCNASRFGPMGNEGCSCLMYQRVKKAESELSAYREALQEYAGTEISSIANEVLDKFGKQ